MFIKALKQQNPALITAAHRLWQQGDIVPDSWVIDVDQVLENGRQLLDVAQRYGIRLYLMTKQIGRNPWLAGRLLDLGYEGIVAVDYKEARTLRNAGLPVSHQGHLVQVPRALTDEVIRQGTDVITLFSLEKAREISDAALRAGRVQAVMLKIYGENDVLYPGQESGFPLAFLDEVVQELRKLPGICVTGLTHFPCLLWDDGLGNVMPTPNFHSLLAARAKLEQNGVHIEQLNAPSASSCTSLPLLAQFGVTHAEPGHALTGTIPANQNGDQPEKIAMVWVSEISHHHNGNSYCYGGGYYRRGNARHALVFAPGAQTPVDAQLNAIDSSSIDYYLPLAGEFPVSSAVLLCFRTQIFVTRSDVVLVSGIQQGEPQIVGRYDSLGNPLLSQAWQGE